NVFHRDDPKAVRVASCLARVVPGWHKESVHMRTAGTERLLLDAADRQHSSVEAELTGRRDLVPARDVAPELLEDLERECEPGRGTADPLGVDRDLHGQSNLEVVRREDAENRLVRVAVLCLGRFCRVSVRLVSALANLDTID